MNADRYADTGWRAPNLVDLDDCTQGLALLQVRQGYRLALCVVGLGRDRAVLGVRQDLEVQDGRVTLLGARLDGRLIDALRDDLAAHLLTQELVRVLGDIVKDPHVQLGNLLKDLGLVEAQRQGVTDAPGRLILVLAQAKRGAKLGQLKDQLTTPCRVQVDHLTTLGVLAHIRKGHVGGVEVAEHLKSHLCLFYYTRCRALYMTIPIPIFFSLPRVNMGIFGSKQLNAVAQAAKNLRTGAEGTLKNALTQYINAVKGLNKTTRNGANLRQLMNNTKFGNTNNSLTKVLGNSVSKIVQSSKVALWAAANANKAQMEAKTAAEKTAANSRANAAAARLTTTAESVNQLNSILNSTESPPPGPPPPGPNPALNAALTKLKNAVSMVANANVNKNAIYASRTNTNNLNRAVTNALAAVNVINSTVGGANRNKALKIKKALIRVKAAAAAGAAPPAAPAAAGAINRSALNALLVSTNNATVGSMNITAVNNRKKAIRKAANEVGIANLNANSNIKTVLNRLNARKASLNSQGLP